MDRPTIPFRSSSNITINNTDQGRAGDSPKQRQRNKQQQQQQALPPSGPPPDYQPFARYRQLHQLATSNSPLPGLFDPCGYTFLGSQQQQQSSINDPSPPLNNLKFSAASALTQPVSRHHNDTTSTGRLSNQSCVRSATCSSRKRPASRAEQMGREGSIKRSNSSTLPTISSLQATGISTSGAADLTGDSFVLSSREASRRPVTPPSSSIVLPQWQADTEVLHCPICNTEFSFWYRKHHCRKCGKVVCDNCSRHRITIPTKYIVQPPLGAAPSPFSSVLPGVEYSGGVNNSITRAVAASSSSTDNTTIAQVRVCNPCTPDPNFSPPPQAPQNVPSLPPSLSTLQRYPGQPDPRQGTSQRLAYTPRYSSHQQQPPPGPPVPERRGSGFSPFSGLAHHQPIQSQATPSPVASSSSIPHRDRSTSSSQVPITAQNRRHATPDSIQRHNTEGPPRFNPTDYFPASSSSSSSHRPRASISHSHSHNTSRPNLVNPSSASASSSSFQIPPPIRRELQEEDQCPICLRELPPYGPINDDSARRAHVDACLSLYSSSPAVVPPRTSSSSTAAVSSSAPSKAPSLQPPRQKIILAYQATEKDCVGEDGQAVECVICFVEFEPGDEMGRLDCFCKFHKACIRGWWDTKGTASCPTHQLHD